jgi:tetratricopeptide (TPR) repeat protein
MILQIVKWVFVVTVISVSIGLLVIYNKPITEFSDAWQLEKEGEKALKSENWLHALNIYEKGNKEHPQNVEIALTLGSLYQKLASQEDLKAVQSREEVPEENKELDYFSKGEALYQKMVQAFPGNAKVYTGFASLLATHPDRVNDALAQTKIALKLSPHDPQLLKVMGDIYKDAAENICENRHSVKKWLYDWASYYYRIAIQNDPKVYQTHFNLGVSYQQNDLYDKAAREYCNALILSPDRYEVHYNLGLALVQLHQVDDGYRHLEKSIYILRESGHDEDAQKLAEQVQSFKNSVFQESQYSTLQPHSNKKPLDSRCLIPAPTESQNPEPTKSKG